MSDTTHEKTYTLEELVGHEEEWDHLAPMTPPGVRVTSYCGLKTWIASANPWNGERHRMCPDCLEHFDRRERARRGEPERKWAKRTKVSRPWWRFW